MEHINLPPFFIGQKVVALANGVTTNLVKDVGYIVLGLNKCCGIWSINVGLIVTSGAVGISCSGCGRRLSNGNPRWIHSKHFKPAEETFQSIFLTRVLEVETKLISQN